MLVFNLNIGMEDKAVGQKPDTVLEVQQQTGIGRRESVLMKGHPVRAGQFGLYSVCLFHTVISGRCLFRMFLQDALLLIVGKGKQQYIPQFPDTGTAQMCLGESEQGRVGILIPAGIIPAGAVTVGSRLHHTKRQGRPRKGMPRPLSADKRVHVLDILSRNRTQQTPHTQ